MAGVQSEITVNFDQLYDALNSLSRVSSDAGPLFRSLGVRLVDSTQQRFDSASSPTGEPWRPSNRAKKQGAKTLRKSGNLLRSITHRASNDEVVWGTNVVYAAIHQFGGKAGRRRSATIPARPYLGISDQDESLVENEVYRFLESAVQ